MREQMYRDLYRQLYASFADEIAKFNANCKMCTLGASALLVSGAINYDNVMFPVSVVAACFVGVLDAVNYLRKVATLNTINKEANLATDNMMKVHETMTGFFTPLANMMGLNIIGHVVIGDVTSMNIQDGRIPSENIIEADCEVVDDAEMNALYEVQNRAYALRDYIEDVGYDNCDDDLYALGELIDEIERLVDLAKLPEYNLAVNKLAEKAYSRSLDLYGISR